MYRRADLLANRTAIVHKNSSWRIGAPRFVTMGVGREEHFLVGKCELGGPIGSCPPRELIPHLIYEPGYRVTPSINQQFAGDLRKVLAIIGPPQPSSQFEVRKNIVICFAKCGIRI